MTCWFLGVDYPRRHVASVTDFPSSFHPKICTSARGRTVETTAEAGTDYCSLGKTCQWDSGGIWSSHAGTTEQAALVPKATEALVHCFRPTQWKPVALSSQFSCMLKTIFPRSQIVLYEEVGVGRPTCYPGFGMAWVDTPENSLYVC